MRSATVAIALAFVTISGCSQSNAPVQLFVAASVSDLATAWQSRAGDSLAFQYHAGGSAMLASQIVAGAQCDLLLAAGPGVLNQLSNHDLVDRVDSAYLHNRLVLVCAGGVSLPESLERLVDPRFERIAIADPDLAPAGTYTRDGLEKAGLWEVLKERLIITGDVRSALFAVASGAADAGFVYETDARTEPELAVMRFEPGSPFPPAEYPLVLIKPVRAEADALWTWLHDPVARAEAARFGFE